MRIMSVLAMAGLLGCEGSRGAPGTDGVDKTEIVYVYPDASPVTSDAGVDTQPTDPCPPLSGAYAAEYVAGRTADGGAVSDWGGSTPEEPSYDVWNWSNGVPISTDFYGGLASLSNQVTQGCVVTASWVQAPTPYSISCVTAKGEADCTVTGPTSAGPTVVTVHIVPVAAI
jgi:hypothetical protein